MEEAQAARPHIQPHGIGESHARLARSRASSLVPSRRRLVLRLPDRELALVVDQEQPVPWRSSRSLHGPPRMPTRPGEYCLGRSTNSIRLRKEIPQAFHLSHTRVVQQAGDWDGWPAAPGRGKK